MTMDDVFGQEKDVMELTTAETTLTKPTAVCLRLSMLITILGDCQADVKHDYGYC